MIAVIDIVIAAILGVAVATLFEGRWGPPLAATPVIGLLHALLRLIPLPVLEESAPSSIVALAEHLAEPWMLIAPMVACAIGSLATATMLQQSREWRGTGFWLPDMERGGRNRPDRSGPPDLESRLNRATPSKKRILVEEGYAMQEPVPQFDAGPAPSRFSPGDARAPMAKVAPEDNKRRAPRRRTLLTGRICADGGVSVPCVIQNLSTTGASLRMQANIVLPRQVSVIDVSNGIGYQAQIRWRLRDSVGVRFLSSFDLSAPEGPVASALAHQWTQLKV